MFIVNAFVKRWLIVAILAFVIIILIGGNFYLRSEFHAGECVQALDGYVWHVNNYSFGKYTVMGWQGNAWGNEAATEKIILERSDAGIPVYHQVTCPEYNPIK